MPTVTIPTTTPLSLPLAYVEPGRPLASVYVHADGWPQLENALHTLGDRGAQPRLVYAYQTPTNERLLGMLVLNLSALDGDEQHLSQTLDSIPGLRVISLQAPGPGLAMAEQQAPDLVGTPAVIFGRPIISSLTRGIVEDYSAEGGRLLYQHGRHAGTLAASALPPLLGQLHLTITPELLSQRITDLQVMGWARVQSATVEDTSRGELTATDTFESAAWQGTASSPQCHFLAGFIAGVFSVASGETVECRETECQATGATSCRFVFQPTGS